MESPLCVQDMKSMLVDEQSDWQVPQDADAQSVYQEQQGWQNMAETFTTLADLSIHNLLALVSQDIGCCSQALCAELLFV